MNKIIEDLKKEILSQDNLCTSDPFFIVQKRVELSCGSDYTHLYKWINNDDHEEEPSKKKVEELEQSEEDYGDTGSWCKWWYQEVWEYVTGCFTRKGCEDYLCINGHNLPETRIYVDSSFRNNEIINLREFILDE